jgi:CheY-like chemotaxis protein
VTQEPLILLVDDEPLLRETLVQIFEGEGFRAVSAAEGTTAIRLAEQMRPDVVICDVLMPGTNGIETAKQIRQALPSVPIILFSGQAAATGLIESAQAEGHDFEVLAKPIRPEFLIGVIRKQLNAASQSQRALARE